MYYMGVVELVDSTDLGAVTFGSPTDYHRHEKNQPFSWRSSMYPDAVGVR